MPRAKTLRRCSSGLGGGAARHFAAAFLLTAKPNKSAMNSAEAEHGAKCAKYIPIIAMLPPNRAKKRTYAIPSTSPVTHQTSG